MTKFILAGGCDKSYPLYGQQLAEVVLREKSHPVILSCMFSRSTDERNVYYYDEWFRLHFGKDAKIEHAREADFFDQLAEADVLYLHGGATKQLIGTLKDTSALKDAIKDKLVIGSSAGANYLSKVCYSPSMDRVVKGSALLDIGVVVHYGVQQFEGKKYTHQRWLDVVDKVRKAAEGSSIVLLPEGHFAIIDV